MRTVSKAILIAASCGMPYVAAALTPVLNPQTPVPIVLDGSVNFGVNVGGNPSGFVAAWSSQSFQAVTSFSSDNGKTWSAPFAFDNSVFSLVSVGAQNSKFLLSWAVNNDGLDRSFIRTNLSLNGTTWQGPVTHFSGAHANSVGNYAPVAAASSGFMIVWSSFDGMNYFLNTLFSADGANWPNPIVQITPSFQPLSTKIAIAGNSEGFLATYVNGSTNRGYASFSSNNGATWTSQVLVAPSMQSGTLLAVGANSSGFFAAWVDSTFKISTSFSSDNGQTWSAPLQIPMSTSVSSIASVSANNDAFVVTWTFGSIPAQASCTTDNGVSWSTPVLFPTAAFSTNIIGVGVSASNALFTWRDNADNAISSYSTFPFTGGGSSFNSGVFQQITPNNPGKNLIN